MSRKDKRFTQGMWVPVGTWVEHPSDKVADICICDPEAMGQEHLSRSYEEAAANALLISAAPAMLETLEMLLPFADMFPEARIKETIKRATGNESL